ncbi:MAG: SUMF1/EgtB/PvdO family nonheme iron enzyme [Lentisphaerae bacterium]|nr:SUMF1/EgtB/PvdO family nonheme iron enzyme [Lentisphaerota bacterium]MBT5610389.1 SUMF1/EgtB/PvdO family nonheme iron enzyme [Lentisphaerota bacterium]MBT7056217.1 SUMF1/EgtB/PvdO family nonheme iron enzyme [Lentisphaerota bacterium]MBT7841861.1 SUMF1/EgtB/PvdO family nonheme iron enzyme [Lentisphaerota bacterium]
MHHLPFSNAVLAIFASLLIFPSFAFSQTKGQRPAALPELGAGTGVASLREVKKRERVLTIRKQLMATQKAAGEREQEITRLTALVQSGTSTRLSADERVLRYMQAQDAHPAVADRLRQDREQSLHVMQQLKAAGDEEYSDERISAYIGQANQALRRMLRAQGEQQKRLTKIKRAILNGRRGVAPPPGFANRNSMAMTLLTDGEHSFYVSEKLVSTQQFSAFFKASTTGKEDGAPHKADKPMTGLSWDMARQFCRWLSVRENATYRLPTAAEAALIGERFPSAVWTNSTWEGPDPAARKVRERFGVPMKIIWDPHKRFGAETTVGELPFASYDELAFTVVTSRKTGRVDRWNRLRTEK